MKILLLVLLVFLGACAAVKQYSSKGEELFYNKCGSCHRIYAKEEFTGDKWRSIMEKMTAKARLSKEEHDSIVEYLTTQNP